MEERQQQAAQAAPRRPYARLFLKSLFFLVGILVVVVIAATIFLKLNESKLRHTKQVDQSFVVEPGASLSRVIQELESAQIIACGSCLQLHTRVFPPAESVKAGTYTLEGALSSFDVLNLLIAGEIAEFKVTLVEGNTLEVWLDVIWAHPQVIKTIEGESRQERYEFIGKALHLEHNHPEGLFLPETYAFSAGTKDISILKRAFDLQSDYLAAQWPKRDPSIPLKTPYEALILASIVEKETGTASERPIIAGVFVNRLKKNMRLETDPTVIYGIKDYDGNITRKHLREVTPYNTYKMKGLPPTPIAGASRAAIHAALHPETTKAIFFVAKGDGSHVFSQTLQAHNAAVREYQLRRRAGYRSAPAKEQ